MPDLLEKCRSFIESEKLILPGERVLVACSGGPDSMVLAWLMHQLVEEIAIAHCNFRLRAESDGEEEMVRRWALENGIACHVATFNTKGEKEPGESTQMAARRMRYDFFRTLCAEQGYERIATAHHADDQVETLVMSFLRGRSGQLMQGIPVRNGPIIRPLLFATKAEIQELADQEEVPFALDATNFTDAYDRNHIRNQVLPAIEKLNPSYRSRFAEHYEDLQLHSQLQEEAFARISDRVVNRLDGQTVLDLAAFRAEFSESLLPLFLSWYLERQGWKGSAAREARRILDSGVGAIWETVEHELLRDRDQVIIRNRTESEQWTDVFLALEVGRKDQVRVGGKELKIDWLKPGEVSFKEPMGNVHYLAWEKMSTPLCIRPWREGDRMMPIGLKGHKKLSDIFVDKRYDRFAKARALVFEDKEGIVLLDSFRIDERVKITPTTIHILKVEILSVAETE